jgi:hypothetical protein
MALASQPTGTPATDRCPSAEKGWGGWLSSRTKSTCCASPGCFWPGSSPFFSCSSSSSPRDSVRTGALDDNRASTAKFGGQATCVECHTDEAKARAAGKHAHVACEACHGALGKHAADPETLKPVRPDPRTLCVVCHAANVAKPTGFPQIDPKDHPDGVCTECHVAHDPGSAPEEKKK